MPRRRPTPKPAPKLTKKTLEQKARQTHQLLVTHLRLDKWIIRLVFADIEQVDPEGTTFARTFVNERYYRAKIVIDLRQYLACDDALTRLQLDLVHEHVHVMNAPIHLFYDAIPALDSDQANEMIKKTFEQASEQLTELHSRAYVGLLNALYK